MSVVTRRPCEFCGTEFLRRLSGPEGAYGSRSTCPSCGKAPTPPVPHPESLRPATDLFPGLKAERATEAPFVIESVTPEPLRAPNFKIFEMDSTPTFHGYEVHRYGQFPPRPVAVVVEAARIFRETPFTFPTGTDPVNTAYEEAQGRAGENPANTMKMVVEVDPPQTRQLRASWVDGGPITCGNENCVRTGECWCGRST